MSSPSPDVVLAIARSQLSTAVFTFKKKYVTLLESSLLSILAFESCVRALGVGEREGSGDGYAQPPTTINATGRYRMALCDEGEGSGVI